MLSVVLIIIVLVVIAMKNKCRDSGWAQEYNDIRHRLRVMEKAFLEDRLFDYKGAMSKLNAARVAQDDPRLIQLIRDYYILPPSTEPYALNKPYLRDFSQDQISTEIKEKLHEERNGFFIECGAFDGEYKSTSLYFERERHWRGLLIEADPISFVRLKSKNRKAYMLNACLSTQPYPVMMTFNVLGEVGRVVDGESGHKYLNAVGRRGYEIKMQCFPLYSILLAINQLNVDFFTLDIEGAELDVLRTVPMDKLNISTLLIEYIHINEGLEPLQKLLQNNGYKVVQIMREDLLVTNSGKAGDG